MLGFLFRRLTAVPSAGGPLFDLLTAEARQSHWYLEGKIPDTLDGRFAVLATLTGLAIVRLERDGRQGDELSVALTERFIEVMESEHRELGLGDPTLGKTVRKLVGMLSRRTQWWRSATAGERDWTGTTRESLYRGEVSAHSLEHSAAALRSLWQRLVESGLKTLRRGEFE